MEATQDDRRRDEARETAGTPHASVHLYSERALVVGSLKIPPRVLSGSIDDLLLARVNATGTGLADVRRVSIRAVKSRSYAGVSYNLVTGCYTVLPDKLPVCVRLASRPSPSPSLATSAGNAPCRHYPVPDTPWYTPEFLAALCGPDETEALDRLVEATLDYAASVVDALELRALFASNRFGSGEFMTRLRHVLREHYAPLGVRADVTGAPPTPLGALGFLLLVTRPTEGAALAGKEADSFPGTFEVHAMRGGSDVVPWAAAWIEAQSTWLHHWLGDPDHGIGTCLGCVQTLVDRVHGAVQRHADVPWIRAVFASKDDVAQMAPWAVRVTDEGLFDVHPALAIRIPTSIEFKEVANVTGERIPFLCHVAGVLFGALPVLANRMSVEALLNVIDQEHAAGEEADVKRMLARFRADLRIQQLTSALDAALTQRTSARTLRTARATMPVTEALRKRRAFSPAPVIKDEGTDTGRLETAIAWHDGIRADHVKIASMTDIEDILGPRGDAAVYPPCMRNVIQQSRSASRLVFSERFTVGMWMADMGFAGDASVRLVGIENSESERDFRDDVNRFNTTRLARTKNASGARGATRERSFGCQNNINRSEPCASSCPYRAEVAREPTLAKLSTDQIAAIRWRCTATLTGYNDTEGQEQSRPPFAIAHPLDYVVLQLRKRASVSSSV